MALKAIAFILVTLTVMGGSVLFHPFLGLCGYIMSYNLNPMGFWWGRELPEIFHRYSLVFSLSCFAGIVIHWGKLRYRKILESQEILYLLLVLIIWGSVLTGIQTPSLGANAMKMTKMAIILLMASHLITNMRFYKTVVWVYIIAAFYSGFEIFSADYLSYRGGRLDVGIGGSDFVEGNFLAAHYLMVLPWIGIFFLNGKWKSKIICLFSAAFITNTLIIIESRASFLALTAGTVFVIISAGQRLRKKIFPLICIGLIGFFFLSDATFWERMKSIDTRKDTMDQSSVGRVEAWTAAMQMFQEYPFGVGEGNFKMMIGRYNPDAEGRDTHNTFFRCLAELGIQGVIFLSLMVVNAFRMLIKIEKSIEPKNLMGYEYSAQILALKIALIMYLVTTCFLTHTYVEEFYWLLMFPLFLKRSYENEILENHQGAESDQNYA